MGKDRGFWLHQQHSAWQPPNLNCMTSPLDLGQQNTLPAYAKPYTCMVSANGTLPEFAGSGLPHLMPGYTNEPNWWYYCLPYCRQTLESSPDSVLKEKFSAFPSGYSGKATPNAISGSVQKRFLVLDQSWNQTSLIYSSMIGLPIQHLASGTQKLYSGHRLCEEDLATKRDLVYQSRPVVSDGLDDNRETDEGSEMHEDTEELNALLYSDDESDDCEEGDEETSTGHSPSAITGYEKGDQVDGSTEEVASSNGLTKRRRLLDGGLDTSSFVDTASSVKPNRSWEYEDDAESSCSKGKTHGLGEMGTFSGNKRSRNERIRETVKILQNIIPGGKGKDAVLVLDEAIHYLSSLKLKAKSIGATTL